MKILVTGGSGFVGINLVRDLAVTAGCQIVSADINPPPPHTERFLAPVRSQIEFVQLDVRDREAYQRLVTGRQVTHILHAAAITPNDETERDRAPFVVDVNLVGSINALAVTHAAAQVERLILCSSSGVYGTLSVPGETQKEDGPLELSHLYGITKYSAELLGERFAQLTGKMITSVRLGSVFGPCEQPSGSRPHISQVMRLAAALKEGRMIRLYGPQIRRDWVFTREVSQCIYQLFICRRWSYPAYNIGSGTTVAFDEVVAPFIQNGLRVEWVSRPEEAEIAMTGASARAALDMTRLKEDTGYSPRFSYEKGVAELLDSLA